MLNQKLWQRLPDRQTMQIDLPALRVRNVTGLSQCLISGLIRETTSPMSGSPEGVGALGLASGEAYSVRLARDRLLVVGADDRVLRTGWHDEGFAVSGMSGALEVFEISGRASDDIVKRATTLPLSGESRSAVVTFAGVSAVLYRYQMPDNLRLHVDRGLSAYIWEWLGTMLNLTSPQL